MVRIHTLSQGVDTVLDKECGNLYIYSLLTHSPTNTPEHKMQKKQGFIVDFTHAQTWKTSNSYLEKHGRYYETPVFSPHLWLSGLRPGSVGGLQAPTN